MPSMKELMDQIPEVDILVLPTEAFKKGLAPWSPIFSRMADEDWENFYAQIRPEFLQEAPIG